MGEGREKVVKFSGETARGVLTEILRKREQDEKGRQQVVRNGYPPKRRIQTGIGDMEVKQPRVPDRWKEGAGERFESKVLPRYLRRTKSMEELLTWLYLKGISTGYFSEAL